ncbi:hypothetical protein D3C78_1236560 [compost metagenome]
MCTASINLFNAALLKSISPKHDCTGRIDNIIDQNSCLSFNIPDNIHNLANVRLRTTLIDNRKRSVQKVSKLTCSYHAAMVRRYNDRISDVLGTEILSQDRNTQHMVHWYIEKSLNLHRMQVHRDDTVCPCFFDQIRYQLCRNRVTRTRLTVLASITIVRNNDINTFRRSPFQGIHHNQELHKVVVNRCAGRLNNVHMAATYALGQLDLNFAVTEAHRLRVSHWNADIISNLMGQFGIGVASEYLQFRITIRHKVYYPPC